MSLIALGFCTGCGGGGSAAGWIGYGIDLYLCGGDTVTGNVATGNAANGILEQDSTGPNLLGPNTESGNGVPP
jgi:parallel beta-helix repeat protein